MESYLTQLESSSIPLPAWGVAVIWLVTYILAYVLFLKAQKLSNAQNAITIGAPDLVAKKPTPALIAAQLMFPMAVIGFTAWQGGAMFVIFGGGWVLASAVSVAMNLRNLLFLRAVGQPGAAEGSVKLSTDVGIRNQAYQVFGMAAYCFLAGVLLAHLALFGAAFILSATGTGFLKQARKARLTATVVE